MLNVLKMLAVVVCVVLGLVVAVQAQPNEGNWDDDSGDHLWSTGANWWPDLPDGTIPGFPWLISPVKPNPYPSIMDVDTSALGISNANIKDMIQVTVQDYLKVSSRLYQTGSGITVVPGGTVEAKVDVCSNPGAGTKLVFSGGACAGGEWWTKDDRQDMLYQINGSANGVIAPSAFVNDNQNGGYVCVPTVHFIMDAGGVTPIQPSGADPVQIGGNSPASPYDLTISDISTYAGAFGDIPLIDFTGGTDADRMFHPDNITFEDLPDGWIATVVQTDSGVTLNLTPAEMQWDGGPGNWADANWSGGQAPAANTAMIINAATNDSVVTVAANFMTGQAGPAGSVAIGANYTASLTVNGGVTLDVSGGVDIGGTGTMLVNGALTAGTGVTVASGGTLGGSGSITGAVTVDSGGTLAPGASIGTLGVTGNVAVGGNYAVEVSGSTAPVAGTNNDSLAVTGAVTVGTIGVDLTWLIGDKIGGDGDGKFGGEYTIVTGSTVSGSPTNVTVNSFVAKFPDGSTVDLWDCYYHDVTGPSGPSDVLVSVGPADPFTDRVTVTLPQVLRGDSTLDGRVMMNDALPIILNWQKDVPVGTGWELGNFNFDNKIMMNDALEIILSWGQKTDADPPGPNPAGAVVAAAVEDRATAVYDAATGYIWLEVNAPLAYLQIIDPTGTGQLGPKDPDGTKPFVGFHPLDPLNLLEDQRPHHVGEMNFGGLPQTAGPHLYVEAVPGILEEDFDLDLYTAALDWTDATVDVVWTPEPATMTLLLLGGAVVLARRRRRK